MTCGLCGRVADYYAGGYRCGVCLGFEDEDECCTPEVCEERGWCDCTEEDAE